MSVDTADNHIRRLRQGRIQPVDTSVIAIRRRIEFVTQSIGDGQLGGSFELILCVPGILRPAQCIRIGELRLLRHGDPCAVVGQAEQEISQRIVGGNHGRRIAGHAALEHEAAAGTAYPASTGRLKMVELEVIVSETILHGVPALVPTQVYIAGKLVVAEQERVGAIAIAQ